MSQKTVAVSLFSGCGGLDIGAHNAGVDVLACFDFDKDSIMTLHKNKQFKKTHIFHEDIVNTSSKVIKNVIKKTNHDKFILIGGPPCQPFSKAGYWVGNDNRKKDKDPRNMIGHYLRLVGDLNPDGFLLENVESLLHPSNKHVVAEIEKYARKAGYSSKIVKVNAADFGVPQKRKRIFIFGSKKVFNGEPIQTHGKSDDLSDGTLKPYVSAASAISKYDIPRYFEPQEITEGGTYYNDLLRVPAGANYISLTKPPLGPHANFVAGKRFWSFLLKLSPDQPSWTIAAQPGPWVGPFHWTSRRLRVPEIAALQTFPEDYQFYGSRRSIQKQIGNAVPPLLGQKMIEYLKINL